VFTVSDDATAAIRTVIGRSDVPPDGGMRIAAEPGHQCLQIALSRGPRPGDTVDNAKLFIAESAGEALKGKTIDAQEDSAGRFQFVLDEAQQ